MSSSHSHHSDINGGGVVVEGGAGSNKNLTESEQAALRTLAALLDEVRSRQESNSNRQGGKHKKRWLKGATSLAISTVALAFTILSLFASWSALDLARYANSWSYYSYEATLVGLRLSLMQLCTQNLTSYDEVCDKVKTWGYLTSVYETYLPKNGTPPVLNSAAPSTNSSFPIGAGAFGAALLIAAILQLFKLRSETKRSV